MRSDGARRAWTLLARALLVAGAVAAALVAWDGLRLEDRCGQTLLGIGETKAGTPAELALVNRAQEVCIDPKQAVSVTVVLKLHRSTRVGLRFMKERVRRQPDVYLNWALLSQTAEDLEDYDLSDKALDESERLKPLVPGEEEDEG